MSTSTHPTQHPCRNRSPRRSAALSPMARQAPASACPWPSNTTPEPSPVLVEISTTDGRTRLTTPMKACWSCSARLPPAAGTVVAPVVGDEREHRFRQVAVRVDQHQAAVAVC